MNRINVSVLFLLVAACTAGATSLEAAQKRARPREGFFLAHYQAKLQKLEQALQKAQSPKRQTRLKKDIARVQRAIERRNRRGERRQGEPHQPRTHEAPGS